MNTPLKYAVFGAGSWATAIVKMLCENLDEVGWYMRSASALEHIKIHKHNPNYLSSVEFNVSKLKLSNDINELANYAGQTEISDLPLGKTLDVKSRII